YLDVVELWTSLELKHGFAANKGATSKGSAPRPELLEKWIRSGRAPRVKKLPVVSDAKEFEAEVWLWWTAMQPEWRKIDADGRPSEDRDIGEGDWGLLSIYGQNGMLNAVAVLCWWGLALPPTQSQSWHRFLADVRWVCEELMDM
ncbi:hypothetical protein BD626DRAFT_411547, partial [Schizophyllum amplum]